MTPVEDRGCRLPGVDSRGDSRGDSSGFRGSSGVTPVEDRGFPLPGCLLGVASEVCLE